MTTSVLFVIVAVAISIGVTWAITYLSGRSRVERLLSERDMAERRLEESKADCEQRLGELKADCKQRLEQARGTYDEMVKSLKESQAEAIEAAHRELTLKNDEQLKVREESLRREAEETIKKITGSLDQNIKDMKESFEAQKKSQIEESTSIKTKFADTVEHIRREAATISSKAGDLTSALKGQNKMQGIFGETILENILKKEGLTEGRDYDSEFWLRDRKGEIIPNEQTGRRMRPDFALHFPDNTDIIIDCKVSLTALSDYYAAETDEQRANASKRNLASVLSHIKELTSKDYQKYVEGRRTLDYVIMFIPNYGAYQLAKQEDPDIFSEAYSQNVLITTEETLLPFLGLIRSAWVQKDRQDNMEKIISAAQKMVDRVALFVAKNNEFGAQLQKTVKLFDENSRRLSGGPQSILKAAGEVAACGVKPSGKYALPQAEEDALVFEATADAPQAS